MELKNVFSWSFSRDRKVRTCLRLYYNSHYGSWGGWARNAPAEARKLYALKHITSMAGWRGDLVHRAIEQVLKIVKQENRVPSKDVLDRFVNTRIPLEWAESLQAIDKLEPAKGKVTLVEHAFPELRKYAKDGVVQKLMSDMKRWLAQWYESQTFKELCSIKPTQWLGVEELTQVIIADTTVHVKLDAAYSSARKHIDILDWKSGQRNPGDRLQLAVYVLYAMEKWHTKPELVRLRDVYVSEDDCPEEVHPALNNVTLQHAVNYVTDSIALMHGLLDDVSSNTPTHLDAFPMCRTDGKGACARCNFRPACYQE